MGRFGVIIIILCVMLASCAKEEPKPIVSNVSNVSNVTIVELPEPDYPFKLVVPQIGFADSAVVIANDDAAVIDAGDQDSIKKISSVLAKYNVSRLRYVVSTNSKFYRSSGLTYLLIRFDTDYFYDNGLLPSEVTALRESEHVGTDLSLAFGNGSLRLLVPYDANVGYSQKSEDNSIPVMVQYGKTRFLLGSDCDEECFRRVGGDVRADVLVAPNHACSGYLSLKMIQMVKPSVVVVVSGENDRNCPSKQALDMLDSLGIKYLSTASGDVTLFSDGAEVYVW